MFVEEDVVTRGVLRDPHRQVFHLRWLGVTQPNQLLLIVYLLFDTGNEKLLSGLVTLVLSLNSMPMN